MRILSLDLKNFRCFNRLQLNLSSNIVLITGSNGSGKTSVLEALHYACYFKSFKSSFGADLIKLDNAQLGFSVDVDILNDLSLNSDLLNVTFQGSGKKIVKLNQKNLSSYNELADSYKVITITEDDMDLIKGYPENRRVFLDHLLLLMDPLYGKTLKTYRKILKNRNSLFARPIDIDSYMLWTKQLYDLSQEIIFRRISLLSLLDTHIKNLIEAIKGSDNLDISLDYVYSKPYSMKDLDFASFMELNSNIMGYEIHAGRSLFGAHLDDFIIRFNNKSSRSYSSRGQQKLVLFLLKISCLKIIKTKAIFLIDDFMTDFDNNKLSFLIDLMVTFSSQVIITCPIISSSLESKLSSLNAQIIRF